MIPWVIYTGIPALNTQFAIALLIGGSINAVTTILYIKAIKVSDLSLTVPLVALTPLFMLLTSPLIVGEYPNFFDYIGILLIVTGSYLLNIKEKSQGYLAPFKALLKEPGPKMMLIVAFLWSIAIKRTSVLMGVLFGHFIFKEKDIQQRLLGAGIMIFGVFVISL